MNAVPASIVECVTGPYGEPPWSTARAAGQNAGWVSNASTPRSAAARTTSRYQMTGSTPRYATSIRRRDRMGLAQRVQQLVERRIKEHHEDRREDQEDQREEDLHRRLVSTCLRV